MHFGHQTPPYLLMGFWDPFSLPVGSVGLCVWSVNQLKLKAEPFIPGPDV